MPANNAYVRALLSISLDMIVIYIIISITPLDPWAMRSIYPLSPLTLVFALRLFFSRYQLLHKVFLPSLAYDFPSCFFILDMILLLFCQAGLTGRSGPQTLATCVKASYKYRNTGILVMAGNNSTLKRGVRSSEKPYHSLQITS
jgi:hypothetical protein